ncbi:MAG: chemotaxis protein CheX [Bacillota bacterium]
MKAEILNAFLSAASNSVSKEVQSQVKRTGLHVDPSEHVTDEVTVYLSMVGSLRGMVLVGMSLSTARSMAATMVGEPQDELTEMGLSALAEMGNLIAGGACIELEKLQLEADITPPTIMIGSRSKISTLGVQRYVMPLATKHGLINLHVAVELQAGIG